MDVLNRTTKEFIKSANTPDYDVADWILGPDLSAVAGVPSRYWLITGDVVSEMGQAEKDVVDAQILSEARDSIAAQLDNVEEILRQVVILSMREINILRAWIMDFKAEVAAASNLGNLQSRVAAMSDYDPRTFEQFKTQIRNDLGN